MLYCNCFKLMLLEILLSKSICIQVYNKKVVVFLLRYVNVGQSNNLNPDTIKDDQIIVLSQCHIIVISNRCYCMG